MEVKLRNIKCQMPLTVAAAGAFRVFREAFDALEFVRFTSAVLVTLECFQLCHRHNQPPSSTSDSVSACDETSSASALWAERVKPIPLAAAAGATLASSRQGRERVRPPLDQRRGREGGREACGNINVAMAPREEETVARAAARQSFTGVE